MKNDETFEIFLVCALGQEDALLAEAMALGFAKAKTAVGGVSFDGRWSDVWRVNLCLRGAVRVLARIDSFRVSHLAQLDTRAHKVEWGKVLRSDVPFRVEVSCSKSRIYHSGAASERIEQAIIDTVGAPIATKDDETALTVMARIHNDLCTISIDTSGELLYKRGHKEAVNQAPMRETMAALFLRQCGYQGTESVVDPMCGSGTFVIEAAEIACDLIAGRSRSFAFQKLANFDERAWTVFKQSLPAAQATALQFYGSDRDAGAIKMSIANAERAGVAACTSFKQHSISDLYPPEGSTAGLVIINPPYGTRIGDKKKLLALYRSLGSVLRQRFAGWRVGIITTEAWLAEATGLPFLPTGAAVQHGGLRVKLYQTAALS